MRKTFCTNCNKEIKFDAYKCPFCSYIIRDRYPYIDLWNVLYQLMFDTKNILNKIIFSEQKNFVAFLFICFNLKIASLIFVFGNAYDQINNFKIFGSNYLITSLLFCTFNLIITFFLFYLLKKIFDREILIKNLYSIFSYSFSYFSLSLFFLLPIELLLYGPYIFSTNPHPFEIKPFIYIIVIFLELFILSYSIVLNFNGMKYYLDNKILPIIITLFLVFEVSLVVVFSELYLKLITQIMFYGI